MGDLLRLGEQPAHIEQCETADPAEVARLALQGLDPAGADGWIAARVDKATQAVKEAHRAVLARVVATMPVEASQRRALAAGSMAANGSIHARVGEPAGADVRSIRLGMRMTQAQFAQAFGFLVATVAGWEQGRFRPDGPAQILLRVIRHRPDAVREALATP